MPEKKTKQEKTVMYVGHAIAGVVAHGTVFKNGLPGQLQQAVKEEPTLNRMLVEIGAVCEARKELQKETSGNILTDSPATAGKNSGSPAVFHPPSPAETDS